MNLEELGTLAQQNTNLLIETLTKILKNPKATVEQQIQAAASLTSLTTTIMESYTASSNAETGERQISKLAKQLEDLAGRDKPSFGE